MEFWIRCWQSIGCSGAMQLRHVSRRNSNCLQVVPMISKACQCWMTRYYSTPPKWCSHFCCFAWWYRSSFVSECVWMTSWESGPCAVHLWRKSIELVKVGNSSKGYSLSCTVFPNDIESVSRSIHPKLRSSDLVLIGSPTSNFPGTFKLFPRLVFW